MNVLAIDLGKTGCRVQAHTGGRRPWSGQGPGAVGMSHPQGPAAALEAIERALQGAGEIAPDIVCLGAAGTTAAPQATRRAAGLLADRFGAPALVTSDAVTSHAGALAGGAGVVLAVGTGTVATAFDPDGRLVQVDGWGQSLGDEGSGWWIGREGLVAVCRAVDGRGPSTVLVEAAEQMFGEIAALPVTMGDATEAIPRQAAFAPQVLGAAEAYDEIAAGIVARAIGALAATVDAAVRGSGADRCCVVGGLARWPDHFHARLRTAVQERVSRPLRWVEPSGTSLDGARLIATDHELVHRGLCATGRPEGGLR